MCDNKGQDILTSKQINHRHFSACLLCNWHIWKPKVIPRPRLRLFSLYKLYFKKWKNKMNTEVFLDCDLSGRAIGGTMPWIRHWLRRRWKSMDKWSYGASPTPPLMNLNSVYSVTMTTMTAKWRQQSTPLNFAPVVIGPIAEGVGSRDLWRGIDHHVIMLMTSCPLGVILSILIWFDIKLASVGGGVSVESGPGPFLCALNVIRIYTARLM